MRRLLVALALAVTLPLPVLAGQITVKEGETLSEIAERHGVSLNQLMQLNGIRDADQVEAGRTLTLPGSGGGRSAQAGRSNNGTVTVKPGETLSEIAERHGISLSRLMQINGIRDADQVEAGQTLRLQGTAPATARSTNAPAASKPTYPAGATEHVVRSGESLSGIASGYGIGLSKLIAINGITDPNHVEAGTRLKLKGTPAAPSPKPSVATAAAPASPARPTTRPQSSTPPASRPAATSTPVAARTTGAPTPSATRPVASATPVARPAASGTSTPTPATRPAATAGAPAASPAVAMNRPDWRTYGPLQVNWAAWQPMGGSMVAPTLNGEGQTLYVAINCSARKLNSTTPTGAWRSWSDPSGDHEQQLVSDYCRARS